jgi:hypothetical protein
LHLAKIQTCFLNDILSLSFAFIHIAGCTFIFDIAGGRRPESGGRIVVAEVVPNGKALSRARELAALYLKAPEVTRRDTRVHFIRPLKERIVREVGYGLSLEGASAADLVKSMQAKNEPVAQKGKSA